MVNTIFSHPLFSNFILPILLVFTLIFAVLEKSKLLGDDKKQVNAIISLVIAIIFGTVAYAIDIVAQLVVFLAVSLVIIFVFMLTYGFISGKKEGDVLNKGLKITLSIIFGLALIVAVLLATGGWGIVYDFVMQRNLGQTILVNLLILGIVGGAIAVVLSSGGEKNK